MKRDPIQPDNLPEETNPAADNSSATPEESREERMMSFSRRAILHAGWAIPTVLAIGLPKNVLAQSGPFPTGPHTDGGIHIDFVPVHVDINIEDPPIHIDADYISGQTHYDHVDVPDDHSDYLQTTDTLTGIHYDGVGHTDGGQVVVLNSTVPFANIGDPPPPGNPDYADSSAPDRDELVILSPPGAADYEAVHYDSSAVGFLIVDHWDTIP